MFLFPGEVLFLEIRWKQLPIRKPVDKKQLLLFRQSRDSDHFFHALWNTLPTLEADWAAAVESRDRFQEVLRAAHFDDITTEVVEAGPFFYAEDYHQQYLAKNPDGYCGIGGTGLSCPVGLASSDG